MKQILTTILIIVSFCDFSFAQDYVPFPAEETSWHVFYAGTCIEGPNDTIVYRFILQGDTLIDNILFHTLWVSVGDTLIPTILPFGAIREEDKKIYYIGNTMLGLNTYEVVLLYDFSKQVGDTIRHDLYNENGKYSVVLNIDSVPISDKYRKRYVVDNNWFYHNPDTIIEGIGSVKNGLLGHISDITTCGHHYWEHICFKQNNEILYINPNYNSCEPIFLKNRFKQMHVSQIKIYPNPLNKGEIARFKNTFFDLFEIFDSQGICIKEFKIERLQQFELNTNNLAPGIYIYQLSNKVFNTSGKILIK